MKRTRRFITVFILVTVLSLFFALPSASATPANEVWVNNVKLDSSAYYLANGSSTATTTKPATGGYVYFNVSAGTLTLYNAQINTAHIQVYESLLYANGDLTVVLAGTSTLQYTAASPGTYMGMYVQGLLTVTGSGSAAIQMNSTNASSAVLYGIYSHDMKIESGTLNVQVSGYSQVFGIDSYFSILVSGGSIAINGEGMYAIAVLAQTGDFTMTGGSITATADTEINAMGLSAGNITLECGSGTFSGSGIDNSEGGYINVNTGSLTVLGGHFIFKGSTSAIRAAASTYSTSLNNNITTYVAANSGGTGKSLWRSAADGVLINSPAAVSPFRYAEFIGPDCYADPPQTGDTTAPWLWAGMALCAVLFVAGWAVRMRTKRVMQ